MDLKSHYNETVDNEVQYLKNLGTSFHIVEMDQINKWRWCNMRILILFLQLFCTLNQEVKQVKMLPKRSL